jgi:hypothetical protein
MATMKTKDIGGQMFLRTVQDSNGHACCVIVGHVVGNEDAESHALFDEATKERYGDAFDHENMVDIKDGEKGGSKSHKNVSQTIFRLLLLVCSDSTESEHHVIKRRRID